MFVLSYCFFNYELLVIVVSITEWTVYIGWFDFGFVCLQNKDLYVCDIGIKIGI